MRVKDMPHADQPRERLMASGATALADRELLALLLGSGTPGVSAIELASRLIAHCGDLAELSRAEPHRLLSVPGMGPAKATRVAAAFHLVRRVQAEPERSRISASADLASAVAPLLLGQAKERLAVVVCDTRGRVLRKTIVSEGGSDQVPASVRDIITTVLMCGGAAFGVAHNHPSGSLDPSPADLLTTAHLLEAAAVVGLRFLDHLVVTDTGWRRIQP